MIDAGFFYGARVEGQVMQGRYIHVFMVILPPVRNGIKWNCLIRSCQRILVAMVACETMLIRSFYTEHETTSECVTTRGLWSCLCHPYMMLRGKSIFHTDLTTTTAQDLRRDNVWLLPTSAQILCGWVGLKHMLKTFDGCCFLLKVGKVGC